MLHSLLVPFLSFFSLIINISGGHPRITMPQKLLNVEHIGVILHTKQGRNRVTNTVKSYAIHIKVAVFDIPINRCPEPIPNP